ncbi:MAG: hypothetical protein NC307_15820 [Roseburia sp.]|nr:hypothetical protein [Roseburia sp.]
MAVIPAEERLKDSFRYIPIGNIISRQVIGITVVPVVTEYRAEEVYDKKKGRDGYNLYLRMVEYKHNHLLFLSNSLVEPDNNLCERKARILKGKINQAISLRSFQKTQTHSTKI